MEDREREILAATVAASHGESRYCPSPAEPTRTERLYLEARELFFAGRYCAGFDKMDEAEA